MFSWIKWPNESRRQSRHSTTPLNTSGAAASRMLIRELLFHVEEHERLRERRQGAPGLSWFQKYPKLQTIVTMSELQQLEFLCSQIPPTHAATVLSRYLIATQHININMLSKVARCITARPDSRQKKQKRAKGDVRLDELPEKPLCVTVTVAGDEISVYTVKVKDGTLWAG